MVMPLTPDDAAVSAKLVEWGAYLALGLGTVLTTLLAWLGKRQVESWESRLDDLEGKLDSMERSMIRASEQEAVEDLRDEIQTLRQDLT